MEQQTDTAATLPESWLKPLETYFNELIILCEDKTLPDGKLLTWLELSAKAAPALIVEMDVDALADQIEIGLAEAVAATLAGELPGSSSVQSFAAGVATGPLADAVAKLGARKPITAKLTSAQWQKVPRALRERAQFSARVESARFLAAVQDKLQSRLEWESEAVLNGQALVDRSSFIADLRQIAKEEGIFTAGPSAAGTVRDIRSAKRLGLIWDMQRQQAAEFARAKMDQDPDVLDAFPAYRFTRMESRINERSDWPARWADAAASVGGEGVAGGDMVALKTSPIWSALSVFSNPWPPYDFGSGMGRTDVDRDEAEALGLLKPGEPITPIDLEMNADLEMGTADIDPYGLEQLKGHFGDQVQERDGALVWRADQETGNA